MKWLLPLLIFLFSACATPPSGPVDAKVVGHGGMGNEHAYPMNSIESIRELCALQNTQGNIYGVELDVQITKDDALVLFHDEQVNVQNERKAIRAFLLKDLPKKNAEGITVIPRLSAVLKDSQCKDLHYFLDVKLHHHEGEWALYIARFAKVLAKEIIALDASEKVTIECQDPVFLNQLKKECNACRTFLYLKTKPQVAQLLAGTLPHAFMADFDGVTIRSDKIDKALLSNLQAEGLQVALFGCSGVRGNTHCVELGADYVQTEDVPMLSDWK